MKFSNLLNFALLSSLVLSLSLLSRPAAHQNDHSFEVQYKHMATIPNLSVGDQELQATSSKLFGPLVFQSYNVAGGAVTAGGIQVSLLNRRSGKYRQYAAYSSDNIEFTDLEYFPPRTVIAVGQMKDHGAVIAAFELGRRSLTLKKIGNLPSFYAVDIHRKNWSRHYVVTSASSADGGFFSFKNTRKNPFKAGKYFEQDGALSAGRVGGHHVFFSSPPGSMAKLSLMNQKLEEVSSVDICSEQLHAPSRFTKYRGDLYTNACPGRLLMVDYNRKSKQLEPVQKVGAYGSGQGLAAYGLGHRWCRGGRYGVITAAQGESGIQTYVVDRRKKSRKLIPAGKIILHQHTNRYETPPSANDVTVQRGPWRKAITVVSAGRAGTMLFKSKVHIKKNK
jgi:hypothetical protein